MLVQMHVTDWTEAQKEDPVLSAVLDWLEVQKKTDLKALLVGHASSKEGRLILQIDRTSQFIRKPYTCTLHPKVRMKIFCFS